LQQRLITWQQHQHRAEPQHPASVTALQQQQVQHRQHLLRAGEQQLVVLQLGCHLLLQQQPLLVVQLQG
jgi:hypothetical protein